MSEGSSLLLCGQILLPDMASLRVVVHEEGGKFLGHRIIPIEALQSGLFDNMLHNLSPMCSNTVITLVKPQFEHGVVTVLSDYRFTTQI